MLRLVFVFFLLFSFSEAREFLLNGKHNSWSIPSSSDEFTKWAQKLRFEIGDSIVVEYDPKLDSILEVNDQGYKTCNKSTPIKSYQDGKTSIDLNRSGWFFFISGADGHCEKGQKLAVDVLNAKHAAKNPSPPLASSGKPGVAPAPGPAAAKSGAFGLKNGVGIYMAVLSSFLLILLVV